MNTGGPIVDIVDQHAEEAAFLWLLRDKAVRKPHYSLSDLADLDDRIEAHVDGLRIAERRGWQCCFQALGLEEPGEVFVASVLALEADTDNRFQSISDVAYRTRGNFRALISALGWVSDADAERWIRSFVSARQRQYQAAGLSGHGIRRLKSEFKFSQVAGDPKLLVHGRCLRTIGELKLRNHLPDLRNHVGRDNRHNCFWAAWSAALLGDKNVGETLKSFVNFDTEFAHRAMQLAPRILETDNCQTWLRGLAQDESLRRYALIGCGVTGDPVYIPTLISQMAVPEHARVAGEAFSMITGIDLAYDDLDMDQPDDFEAGPTEDPADDNVDLDPDEDLPWPNPEFIQSWWDEHGRNYQAGTRHLCGQPISDPNCRRVLREGFQRQRIAAAYELALMNPDEPLFEWRAPGYRQQEWLGLRQPRRSGG